MRKEKRGDSKKEKGKAGEVLLSIDDTVHLAATSCIITCRTSEVAGGKEDKLKYKATVMAPLCMVVKHSCQTNIRITGHGNEGAEASILPIKEGWR